ncbi:hypothetical protein RGUI_3872 [Rhodovulum sp. P5]|uniref:hypothetical protein n=1 Tax=Rhodovulum sp. P5 TaxID=1564506 RepID=UPI0009C1FB68|nr:hypothetical protein [Rhodovulum sp. P5]ARE42013.1 hypothetical protein RGUI_3872 [Rhodovulum sp. P5]
MTKVTETVQGVHAPPPKPTIAGALWVALVITLPLAVIVMLIQGALWLLGR